MTRLVSFGVMEAFVVANPFFNLERHACMTKEEMMHFIFYASQL
jgi:hypothetical protein